MAKYKGLRPTDKQGIASILPGNPDDSAKEEGSGKVSKRKKKQKLLHKYLTMRGLKVTSDFDALFNKCLAKMKMHRRALRSDERENKDMAIRVLATTCVDWNVETKNVARDYYHIIGCAILESCFVLMYRKELLRSDFGVIRWEFYNTILKEYLVTRSSINDDTGGLEILKHFAFIDDIKVPKERPKPSVNVNVVKERSLRQEVITKSQLYDKDINKIISAVGGLNVVKVNDDSKLMDGVIFVKLKEFVKVSDPLALARTLRALFSIVRPSHVLARPSRSTPKGGSSKCKRLRSTNPTSRSCPRSSESGPSTGLFQKKRCRRRKKCPWTKTKKKTEKKTEKTS